MRSRIALVRACSTRTRENAVHGWSACACAFPRCVRVAATTRARMPAKSSASSVRSSASSPLSAQFASNEFIDELRIGLATRRLHHLTNEEPHDVGLPRAVLRDALLIGGEDVVDEPRDRIGIACLRKAF